MAFTISAGLLENSRSIDGHVCKLWFFRHISILSWWRHRENVRTEKILWNFLSLVPLSTQHCSLNSNEETSLFMAWVDHDGRPTNSMIQFLNIITSWRNFLIRFHRWRLCRSRSWFSNIGLNSSCSFQLLTARLILSSNRPCDSAALGILSLNEIFKYDSLCRLQQNF